MINSIPDKYYSEKCMQVTSISPKVIDQFYDFWGIIYNLMHIFQMHFLE